MSEQNESFVDKFLRVPESSEQEDKVREYIIHRIKDGANLRDVLQEEYVLRNSTQAERDEIIRDPNLAQQSREGLKQDFDSDELAAEQPTTAVKGQSYEGRRQSGPFRDIDRGTGPPSSGA